MMSNGLIQTAARSDGPAERRIYGVVVGRVINNIDIDMLGRVQVHLPWLPEVEPWARVAVPMAGKKRGTYIMPQIDDEVLLAFNHGDIRDPYVIGSLWNSQDRPPVKAPLDAVTKRIIHTQAGHELELDDLTQSITITSSSKQKITINPKKIDISAGEGATTISLETDGKVSIQAPKTIDLNAPTINLKGKTVKIDGSNAVKIQGGQVCDVKASTVKIN